MQVYVQTSVPVVYSTVSCPPLFQIYFDYVFCIELLTFLFQEKYKGQFNVKNIFKSCIDILVHTEAQHVNTDIREVSILSLRWFATFSML